MLLLVVGGGVIGIALAAWGYANHVAGSRLRQQLSNATGDHASVEKATLMSDGLAVKNVTMGDEEAPWFTAEQVAIKAPLRELTNAQPQLDALLVEGARLTLPLNAEGALMLGITKSAETRLPADIIQLRDSTVTITQPGRQDLVLTGTQLEITKQGDGFRIAGNVNSALGTTWNVSGSGAWGQAVDVEVSAAEWTFDTQKLAALPLAPEAVNRVPATGQTDITVQLRLPSDNPPHANITLRDARLHVPSAGIELSSIAADITADANLLDLQVLNANLGTGTVSGQASVGLSDPSEPGPFALEFQQVPLDAVRTITAIPKIATGAATGAVTGELRFPPRGVDLSLNGSATIHGGRVSEIVVDTCEALIQIDRLSLRTAQAITVSGNLQLKQIQVSDTSLEAVARTFPVAQPWLTDVHSSPLSVQGELTIPLATAFRPLSWTAAGTIRTEAIQWRGRQIHDITSSVSLRQGQWHFPETRARVGNGDVVATGWLRPLEENGQAQFEIQGSRISSPTLIAWALDPEDPTSQAPPLLSDASGELAFATQLEFPLQTARDVSTWSGTLQATSAELITHGLRWRDATMSSRIADGKLQISDLQLRIGEQGKLQVEAQVPILGDGPTTMKFAGVELPARALVRLAEVASPRFQRWLQRRFPESSDRQLTGAFELQGQVAFASTAQLPLLPTQGAILAESSSMSWGDAEFSRFRLQGEISASRLTQAELDAGLAAGGTLAARLTSPVDLRDKQARVPGRVEWDSLSVSSMLDVWQPNFPVTGNTSGSFEAQAPLRELADPSKYTGTGSLRIQSLRLDDLHSEQLQASIRLANSQLELASIRMEILDTPLQASAAVALHAPFEYKARITGNNVAVGDVMRRANLDWNVTGDVAFHVQASGELNARQARLDGQLIATNLQAEGRPLSPVTLRLNTFDRGHVRIQGNLFGGQLDAVANMPNKNAPRALEIQLTDMELADVPSPHPDVLLTGHLHGDIKLPNWRAPATATGHLRIQNGAAKYQGLEIEDLAGDLQLAQSQLTYRFAGAALDGRVSVEGETPLDRQRWPEQLPARLQLESVNLADISNRAHYADLRSLSGVADAELDLIVEIPKASISGTGEISVRDVQWKHRRMISLGTAKLELQSQRLKMHDLRAAVGNGFVSGTLELPLSPEQSGTYELVARQVDFGPLVRQIWPQSRGRHSLGRVNARASGRIGREIRGTAVAEVAKLGWQQAAVTRLRVPLNYVVHPDLSGNWNGRIKTERASGRVQGGRLVASATVEFGRATNLDVDAWLTRVDMRQLIASRSAFGHGRLSGHLKLSARSIRSRRDLKGRFRGRLDESQSLQLPVLSDLARFASLGQVSQTAFDSGEIDLRLANDVISTPGFVLQSESAEMFIQGSMSLQQKLDLNVAVQTGNFTPGFGLSGLVETPVAQLVSPHASVILRAAEYLSNRVVYLHVGGTVRSPHYQLRTDKLIQDALIQFYLPQLNLQEFRQRQ